MCLDVVALSGDRLNRLKGLFPNFYVLHNPIDLTAQVKDDDFLTVLNELKDDYDGFVVIALPNVLGITERLAELMKHFRAGVSKPLVFHIPADGVSKRITARLEKAHIPVYSSPERAIRGLTALLRRH